MNQSKQETEREELEYYRKKEELYKYAREFQLKLAKDGFIALAFIDLNIHLVNGFNQFNCGIFTPLQGLGFLSGFKPNPVIKVYRIDFLDDITIKKDIRHEMLHCVLWLYDLPSGDDSPEFHAMCKIYQAGAYKKVPKDKQKYCNELKQLSKVELFKKLLKDYDNCIEVDEEGNEMTTNYYDFHKERREGITQICTNWDVKKIKREVI